MFHCHLTYCCLVWGCASMSALNELQILQNRTIKAIYRLPLLTHTVDVYEIANIPNLKNLYLEQVAVFVFNILHKRIFNNIIFPVQESQYLTRNCNRKLKVISCCSRLGQSNIEYIGPRIFNQLPDCVVSGLSFYRFRSDLRNWLKTVDMSNIFGFTT
jgi:hypothetical protein